MLIQQLDEYLCSLPPDDRARNCFHPSQLHKSANALFKQYFEGDSFFCPPRLKRVFANGHGVHDRLQTWLANAGILLEAEVPVRDEDYEIVGHCDGRIVLAGVSAVLEIKSINDAGFKALTYPKSEHVGQVNVYMHCLGLEHGVLLYENKNDQELKEFFVKKDDAVLRPILEKIRFVQNLIKTKTLPPPEKTEKEEKTDLADNLLNAFGGKE